MSEEEKGVVFITGCSDGGIGASLALEFANNGFLVVATARALDSMKKLSLHENIHPLVLDVTNFDAAKVSVEHVIAEYGHIDILVNNAGVLCVGPIAELPLSSLELTYKTNVLGPVVLVQAVVPHMASRGKGRIVNVGSISARAYGPWTGGYVSSKAALEALNDALRLELKPFGIDVVLVMPGAIVSNIGKAGVALLDSGVLDGLKLYKPFVPAILKRANMSQAPKSTPTQEFAKKVVAQVVAKSPPRHFSYGRYTTIFAFLFYAPFWLRDYLAAKAFGLDRKVSPTAIEKKTD